MSRTASGALSSSRLPYERWSNVTAGPNVTSGERPYRQDRPCAGLRCFRERRPASHSFISCRGRALGYRATRTPADRRPLHLVSSAGTQAGTTAFRRPTARQPRQRASCAGAQDIENTATSGCLGAPGTDLVVVDQCVVDLPGDSPPRGGRRCSSAAAGLAWLLKRPEKLTGEQRGRLAELVRRNLRTVRAYGARSRRTFNRCGATCRRTGPASSSTAGAPGR